MAFKFKTFAAVRRALIVAGTGRLRSGRKRSTIKVGVIVGAEQQVAANAQKIAKEKYGTDVELVTFNGTFCRIVLSKGDIDANAFSRQTVPWISRSESRLQT